MGVLLRRRSASELQFDAGHRVGPYQIVRRVAPSCFDAEDLRTSDAVRIELASEEDSALIDVRFSRAATQLQLIEHPCIAPVLDHGVLADGRPWVASDRHPGTPLSDVLAQRKLLHHETIALVHSVATVLAHAHQHRIVHGSLRPHHLTLSRGAKVVISGWAWLRTACIPAFGDPVMTSVFHAPEHDGQSAIDGRADVYALGAIAYRALTGVFPDVSRDLMDVNDPLAAAIENMLAVDPRDRASAASIAADLAPLRERRRRESQPPIAPVTEPQSTLPDAERTDMDPMDLDALDKTNFRVIAPTAASSQETRLVNVDQLARGSERVLGQRALVAGPTALTRIIDMESVDPTAKTPVDIRIKNDAETRVVLMSDVLNRG
ncbi:hypothetical protein BH11MYX2_BH11MYX2_11340 [soil metagenome]